MELFLNKAGKTRWGPRLIAVSVAVVMFAGLAACGRKGPLEPHPAEKRAKAPAGASDVGSKKLTIGSRRKTLSSPITVPDRPFVLDRLL